MKKLFAILLSVCMLISLAACGGETPTPETEETGSAKPTETVPAKTEAQSTTEVIDDTVYTAVIYADLSCGTGNAEYIQEYPFEYIGDEIIPEDLAEELSALTGLDFDVTVAEMDDYYVVDWSADSTLVAGMDDREQKEEFFFYDIVTLRWFMMDSLWLTLADFLETENIHYTMDGGQQLTLEDMAPVDTFSPDSPYMGSAFYYEHASNNTVEAYFGYWEYDNGYILELTEDEWYLYGDGGVLLQSGTVEYEDDGAWLIGESGSSGSGNLYFNDDGQLTDTGTPLTKLDKFPYGGGEENDIDAFLKGEWLYSDMEYVLDFDGVGGYTLQSPEGTETGTYEYDGQWINFIINGESVSRASIGDGDIICIEGDAGSYFYKNEQ